MSLPLVKAKDPHSLWGGTLVEWAKRDRVRGPLNDIIKVPAIDFAGRLERVGVPYYLKADIVRSETICLRALLKFKNKPDFLSTRSEKVTLTQLEHPVRTLSAKRFIGGVERVLDRSIPGCYGTRRKALIVK